MTKQGGVCPPSWERRLSVTSGNWDKVMRVDTDRRLQAPEAGSADVVKWLLVLAACFWTQSSVISEGNGTPLQYSCLENPMDGGAWKAAVRGVTKSDSATSLSLFTFMHWRRKWQPTPVFLPGESHGQRSLAGYIQPMGLHSQTHLKRLSTHTHA